MHRAELKKGIIPADFNVNSQCAMGDINQLINADKKSNPSDQPSLQLFLPRAGVESHLEKCYNTLFLQENNTSMKPIILTDKNCVQRNSAKTQFI